jgi:hypothetical protein
MLSCKVVPIVPAVPLFGTLIVYVSCVPAATGPIGVTLLDGWSSGAVVRTWLVIRLPLTGA